MYEKNLSKDQNTRQTTNGPLGEIAERTRETEWQTLTNNAKWASVPLNSPWTWHNIFSTLYGPKNMSPLRTQYLSFMDVVLKQIFLTIYHACQTEVLW